MMKVNVTCIYKTGGDYTAEYVAALRDQLSKIGALGKAQLVCLTDDPAIYKMPGVIAVELENGWPGWWSVPEAYRVTGPTLLVGLDHIFLKPIDRFLAAIQNMGPRDFVMMRAFAKKRLWATGVTAWNGDWRWLYERFDFEAWKTHAGGEQDYVRDVLMDLTARGKARLIPAQKWLRLVSYKKHVRLNSGVVEEADMILFHGLPRPHQVPEQWIRDLWRGK
jgi:hypothetical protein